MQRAWMKFVSAGLLLAAGGAAALFGGIERMPDVAQFGGFELLVYGVPSTLTPSARMVVSQSDEPAVAWSDSLFMYLDASHDIDFPYERVPGLTRFAVEVSGLESESLSEYAWSLRVSGVGAVFPKIIVRGGVGPEGRRCDSSSEMIIHDVGATEPDDPNSFAGTTGCIPRLRDATISAELVIEGVFLSPRSEAVDGHVAGALPRVKLGVSSTANDDDARPISTDVVVVDPLVTEQWDVTVDQPSSAELDALLAEDSRFFGVGGFAEPSEFEFLPTEIVRADLVDINIAPEPSKSRALRWQQQGAFQPLWSASDPRVGRKLARQREVGGIFLGLGLALVVAGLQSIGGRRRVAMHLRQPRHH